MLSRPVIEFETDDRLGLGEFGIQTGVVQPQEEPDEEPPAEELSGRTMVYSTAGRLSEPLEQRARTRAETALLLLDGRRLVVGPAGLTLGRSRQSDVVLTIRMCRATTRRSGLGAGRGCSTDLGSTNGSSINGRRVEGSEVIRAGDEIELGSTRLRFELE